MKLVFLIFIADQHTIYGVFHLFIAPAIIGVPIIAEAAEATLQILEIFAVYLQIGCYIKHSAEFRMNSADIALNQVNHKLSEQESL